MRNDQRSIRVETKIRKFAFTFSRKLRLEKDKQKIKKDTKRLEKDTKRLEKDTKRLEKDNKKDTKRHKKTIKRYISERKTMTKLFGAMLTKIFVFSVLLFLVHFITIVTFFKLRNDCNSNDNSDKDSNQVTTLMPIIADNQCNKKQHHLIMLIKHVQRLDVSQVK